MEEPKDELIEALNSFDDNGKNIERAFTMDIAFEESIGMIRIAKAAAKEQFEVASPEIVMSIAHLINARYESWVSNTRREERQEERRKKGK